MATVQIKRCDRCGRFEDEADAVEVTITVGPSDADARDRDLCEQCATDLLMFLDEGRKLSRSDVKVKA